MNKRDFMKLLTATSAGAFSSRALGDQLGTELKGQLGHHIAPKAKRVIYLYMAGGPSQFETFDHKPAMLQHQGEELPASILKELRPTGMSANQSSLPIAASEYKFSKHGECGMEVSELLPHTAKIVDDIALVKTMYTEAINHGPANTFMQTGSQIAGRPSLGAWLNYGLGTLNANLPSFVVLRTKGKGGQPLFARLWGNGFLPAHHQGVMFRPEASPVVHLNNPSGISREARRSVLDKIHQLEEFRQQHIYDPTIQSRLEQYEMAFRMQEAIPQAVDLKNEPKSVTDMYGKDALKPGTFANNCLMARRLAERGVRSIQLYHQGWDQHNNCPGGVKKQCQEVDQASAALIQDLKQRGMLEDTLVIWGGEFGRTAYSQGKIKGKNYGRDHHPNCFPTWFAGGGIKGGTIYGETDDFSCNIASKEKMHIHDFHATILHQLGIDHTKLTYKFQGREFRLTDVHGHIVKDILA